MDISGQKFELKFSDCIYPYIFHKIKYKPKSMNFMIYPRKVTQVSSCVWYTLKDLNHSIILECLELEHASYKFLQIYSYFSISLNIVNCAGRLPKHLLVTKSTERYMMAKPQCVSYKSSNFMRMSQIKYDICSYFCIST